MSDACLDLTEKLNSIEDKLVDIQSKMLEKSHFDLAIEAITRKLDKLQKSIGEFPTSVISSLIVPCTSGGTGSEAAPEEILNLQELIEWLTYRIDEVVGQFEISIEIEDADQLTEGDQKSTSCIPNIAEAMAEIVSLAMLTYANSEALLVGARNQLTMSASTHQQVTIANRTIDALYDYTGINTDKEKIFLPLGCSPEHKELAKFLQPKEVEVGVRKFPLKGTTLQEQMTELLHGSSVIRSVFWRKLETGVNMGLQIANLVKGYKGTESWINSNKDDDFADKIEEIEKGFINESGASDAIKPYGKPYDQRPNIKILG